jgi:non-heme Fe2+,alpha-ketoglutarate-dependent halogenase
MRDPRIDQPHGHIVFRPVFDLATCPQLLDDVETLLGPDLLLWKGRVVVRDAGSRGQGWHVDRDNMLLGGVHISVAVTELTADNGCVQFIPNTHKYNISLQQQRRAGAFGRLDSAAVLALADRAHPENAPHKLVTMALESGEYFLTFGGLWHCVLPNTTDSSRVALVARYMRPDVQSRHWDHDDEFIKVVREKSLPCILVRGADHHSLNDLYPPPDP